jgi:hypothetical protein
MTDLNGTANSAQSVRTVPPAAYMLADHLDAALAAGEDILAAGRRAEIATREAGTGAGRSAALRSAVELIRSLELALITRVLKAREWSASLNRADNRFTMVGQLFTSGTHTLVDAIAAFADATEADFETGDGMIAYFRSRGMLDAEAACIAEGAPLVGEQFLVSGRNALGPLLDLVAAYLDALEVQFVLFADPVAVQTVAAASVPTDAHAASV